MVVKKAQMKIAQMIFMILAVFLFFILVGLFLLNISLENLGENSQDQLRGQAKTSLEVISGMSEFNCDDSREFCLDEDKLNVMSGEFGKNYSSFYPVSSIKVYRIVPNENREFLKCPGLNCNYFEIYDDGQENLESASTFVSICRKNRLTGVYFEKCDIGKLEVGRKINE